MPNWVTNQIAIKGSKETLDGIFKRCEKDGFKFSEFFPIPAELNISSSSLNNEAAVVVWNQLRDKVLTLSEADEDEAFANKEKMNNQKIAILKASYFSSWESLLSRGLACYDKLKDENIGLPPLGENFPGEITTKRQFVELGQLILDNYTRHGCADWYDWCHINWGTKWDVDECIMDPPITTKDDESFLNLYLDNLA